MESLPDSGRNGTRAGEILSDGVMHAVGGLHTFLEWQDSRGVWLASFFFLRICT